MYKRQRLIRVIQGQLMLLQVGPIAAAAAPDTIRAFWRTKIRRVLRISQRREQGGGQCAEERAALRVDWKLDDIVKSLHWVSSRLFFQMQDGAE